MSQEIGTAYVTIMPRVDGLSKEIEQGIDGGATRGEKKASSRVVGAFAKWGKRATIAGAATVAAFTIGGGISRLMQLEQAEQSLRGLGYSADEIAAITQNALAAVRGTAFGLGEAVNVAAAAMGAGIQQGSELERFLTLTGDAAAQAGIGMDHMGQIMTRVAGDGRIMMDSVSQLGKNGLHVLPMLSDAFGVTQEEMRRMVSSGEVSADRFMEILEDNIGGSALAMGDTVSGSFANLRASLGRIGASLLGPVFSALPGVFQGITNALGPLEENASKVGEAIGSWMSANGPRIMDALRSAAAAVVPLVVELGQAVGSYLVEAFRVLGPPIGELVGALGRLLPIIAEVIGAALPYVIAAWQTQFQIVGPIVARVVGFLADLVNGLIDAWQGADGFRTGVARAFDRVLSAARTFASWFEENVWPVLVAGWEILSTAAREAADFFMEYVWPIMKDAGEFIANVFGLIGDAAQLLWAVLQPVFWVIRQQWALVWSAISAAWSSVGKPIFSAVASVVAGVADAVWSAFKMMADRIKIVWDLISAIIGGALDVIRGLIQAATKIFQGDWGGAWDAISGAVGSALDRVVSAVRGIPGRLLSLLRNFKDAGKKLFSGFIDGIKSVTGAAGDLARAVGDKLKSIVNTVVINPINRGVRGLVSTINKVPGVSISAPQIPQLAAGALVTAPTLALIGEAGPEVVFPLSGRHGRNALEAAGIGELGEGGSGTVFNIYTPEGIDAIQTAQFLDNRLDFVRLAG